MTAGQPVFRLSLILQVAWLGPGGRCGPGWAWPWQCAHLTKPPPRLAAARTMPLLGQWTHGATQSAGQSSCPTSASGQDPQSRKVGGTVASSFAMIQLSRLHRWLDFSFDTTSAGGSLFPFIQMNCQCRPPSCWVPCKTIENTFAWKSRHDEFLCWMIHQYTPARVGPSNMYGRDLAGS